METKNIYQKLLTIQKSINGLGKDKKSFSYSYVTGDKVLDHIKPFMNELGLLLKQEILSIENTRQDYITSKGDSKSEILSRVEMRFTWIDCETGEADVNLFGANGQNDWEKGLGSALTYAERYFLLKFFHIATDADDIDNDQRKKDDGENKTTPKREAKDPKDTNLYNHNNIGNLPVIANSAFQKAIERIKGGELDVYGKVMASYSLVEAQKNLLEITYRNANVQKENKSLNNQKTA